MGINSGGEHEEMAINYQILEMNRLNNLLKKFGIADKDVRKNICSEYAFDSSYFLDAGRFEHEGKRLYPQICFAERQQDPDANLGEQQERIVDIPTGSYQQQDEEE